MRLFFVAVAAIALPLASIAGELRFITKSDPIFDHYRAVYLDMSSLRTEGEFVIATLIEEYLRPPTSDDGTRSVISIQAFHCKNFYYALVENHGTTAPNGTGRVLWRNKFEWKTEPLVRTRMLPLGSLGRTILDAVCREAELGRLLEP